MASQASRVEDRIVELWADEAGLSGVEFCAPVEEIEPALVEFLLHEGQFSADFIKLVRAGTTRGAEKFHARFFRGFVAFAQVARLAGRDDILECCRTFARSREHVIKGQIPNRFFASAILAPKAVA